MRHPQTVGRRIRGRRPSLEGRLLEQPDAISASMRRNIKKTTPTLVGRKRRDSGGQVVSPTGTPRAGAGKPAAATVGAVATLELSVQSANGNTVAVAAAGRTAAAEGGRGGGGGGARGAAQDPAEGAGEASLMSELDELLMADDIETDSMPQESPQSYMTPTVASSASDGLTPQQMEFARASFLSSNSSAETENRTPMSNLHMAYVPGEAPDKLPSPVRPHRGGQGGDPRLEIDQSVEVGAGQPTIPRTPSNQLPSPVGLRSIQLTESGRKETLEPLMLSPAAMGGATHAPGQQDILDSVAFCIAPCIDCLDLLCATGAVVLGVVQRVDYDSRLHLCPCEPLIWLLLLLGLACLFFLPAMLGYLGRGSQRHRWMLSCSSPTSVFLAAVAIAGSAAVLADTHAAANGLQDVLERHCSGCRSGSSSGGDGATSIALQHVAFAGGVLAISGFTWLARGVAGCVISRHLHRADRRNSTQSGWTDPTTEHKVETQGRRTTSTDTAAASKLETQRQSGSELKMMLS